MQHVTTVPAKENKKKKVEEADKMNYSFQPTTKYVLNEDKRTNVSRRKSQTTKTHAPQLVLQYNL